jgi:hypothetical protein
VSDAAADPEHGRELAIVRGAGSGALRSWSPVAGGGETAVVMAGAADLVWTPRSRRGWSVLAGEDTFELSVQEAPRLALGHDA